MHPIRSRQSSERQEKDASLPPPLRALRASEVRIKELQGASPAGTGRLRRDDRLCGEAEAALRAARTCAAEGVFDCAAPGDLAGMINSFSKARRYPVTRTVDAILALIKNEVVARSRVGQLVRWAPKHLAIMASGLGKCEGPYVQEALAHLAQAVTRIRWLREEEGWTAQTLAMLANGLAKGEGAEIREALSCLARTVSRLSLTQECGWEASFLVMMACGLGKGGNTRAALDQLAQAVRERELTERQGWTAQRLAMMVGALGKGEGDKIQAALAHLAQAIARQGAQLHSHWKAQDLAMLANGLSKSEGQAAREALSVIARAVSHRKQALQCDWTALDLAVVTNGLSKGEGPEIQQALGALAQSLKGRELTATQGWTSHHLAMMANGLCKAEGAAVQEALTGIAHQVRQRPGRQLAAWPAQHLGMMINGLAKGEGPDVMAALTQLAQVINSSDLTWEQGWSGWRLATVINGLGKGTGPEVRDALTRLARAVSSRELTPERGWSIQQLAMVANGLGKGSGQDVKEALTHLALAVTRAQRAPGSEWTVLRLAMIASGLTRGSGPEVREALAGLARRLDRLALTREAGWNSHMLAMVTEAIGQTMPRLALFDKLVTALCGCAFKEPEVLVSVLGFLCRQALCEPHLKAARRLLAALEACHFTPANWHLRHELLWNSTLLHFAAGQLALPDPALADAFARAWHHYLGSPARCDRAPDRKEAYTDLWHASWAAAWWQPVNATRPPVPVPAYEARKDVVSFQQQQVFDQLSRDLPGHDLQMEVNIDDFPVDILIDGHLCVEVDGPEHFVDLPTEADDGADPAPVRGYRTKDQFVDHMLHRYGYRVFRFAEAHDPVRLRRFSRQIRSVIEAGAAEAGTGGPVREDPGDRQPVTSRSGRADSGPDWPV